MTRTLRLLLRFFPTSFRERYGEELADLLAEQTRDIRFQHGWTGVARMWAFQSADLLRSALAERRTERHARLAERQARRRARHGSSRSARGRVPGPGFGPPSLWAKSLVATLGRDARYALRTLRKTPGFTAIAVLTLALGVGATTAIFTVINGVLLKPLSYTDPESLVVAFHSVARQGLNRMGHTPETFFTYRDENRVFEDFAAWHPGQLTVTGLDDPERVSTIVVDDAVFPILGVRPALGRNFTTDDIATDSPYTVILAHGFWQRRFGGDPAAIGQTIRANGTAAEIIGVMPRGFRFLDFDPAIYAPVRLDTPAAARGTPGGRSQGQVLSFDYQTLARLRPGVTLEDANRDIVRMIPISVERYGWLDADQLEEWGLGANVRPLKEVVVRDIGAVLWLLLGTVGIVLLIACANVANLFLVRADGRRREVAVRTAIGASRGRIAHQFLVESVILAVLGGVGGLWIAYLSVPLLIGLAPSALPRLDEITVDPAVLLFTLAVSMAAGIVFGLFPVAYYGAPDLSSALKEGGHGASVSSKRHRLRATLATAEVALALVLLVGSGLMIRSFRALAAVDPGFERPEQVLTFRLALPRADVPYIDQAIAVYEQLLDQISQVPGVTSVGAISGLTMERRSNQNSFLVEDAPGGSGEGVRRGAYKAIAGDYLRTMGIPLLAGRTITWDDIRNRRPVGLITENFAREVWGDPATAIGKRIRHAGNDPWREIVGVVGSVRDVGLRDAPPRVAYWPLVVEDFLGFETWLRRDMAFVVRSEQRSSTSLLPDIRRAVASVDPNLPLAEVSTLDRLVARDMARTSFTVVMLAIAAGVALLLGTVGIYGVISYVFARRTREISIRVALGATRGDVRKMVVRQGAWVAVPGVLIGGAAAIGLTRFLSGLLYGVSPADPTTYLVAAAVVVSVALLASYLPARRAARVDPLASLRSG